MSGPLLRSVWVALVILLIPGLTRADDLESRIAPLIKAHKGKAAVAVRHLTTGEEFYLNADEIMPTASLIKLPVMVETYSQVSEGKVKLETTVTLRKEDKVPGSGILTTHFSDGMTMPLRDAVRLMIAYSDNTATNLVLDQIGIPSTTARMTKLGLKNTRLNSKVFRGSTSVDKDWSRKYGLGSTTAREMVDLLALIEAGKVVSPEACKEMIAHLKTCDTADGLQRYLPPKVAIAHKSGAVNAARTEAGIIYLPSGPVAVCVLTNQNEDQRWITENAGRVLAAKVAKEIVDYFATKKTEKKPTPPEKKTSLNAR
jgi:beta-lactamase class A